MSSYEDLLKKEKTKQSFFSPSIVSDKETISRVLLTPKHYKNGMIVPTAFEQILQSEGFSVLRRQYDFDNSLEKTIEKLEKDNNKYIGYASASVAKIRSIVHERYRVFVVLDTAREDIVSHADIFTTRNLIASDGLDKKFLIKYIRLEIAKLFNENKNIKTN